MRGFGERLALANDTGYQTDDDRGEGRPMARPLTLSEDRLFPAEPTTREIARRLYGRAKALPIISPHGHTDPEWFAGDAPFADATSLLLAPDHYLYRMLYSQGVPLERLG